MRELHVVVPYKRIWLGPNLEKKNRCESKWLQNQNGKRSAFYCSFRAAVD